MQEIMSVLSYFLVPQFVLVVFAGSIAGLFVGSIPGISVSMATALLVSITYSWTTEAALAMIMGVYVVGVFSGALPAILINIPGAPSSVVTTLDGYPLAKRGEAFTALRYATVYSVIGSVFGMCALWILARPITALALSFYPMDYFLLALFGLTAAGSLTAKSFSKGLISAFAGIIISLIGLDPVAGTPRLTFGISELTAGIDITAALIGLFGFSEVLWIIAKNNPEEKPATMVHSPIKIKDVLKHWGLSLYAATIGVFIGALPGAGGPVASFLAYGEARRIIKKPSVPFGEGAVEGITASESANNACIGGALIPMLTLAVPGDAVTAILLSVFYVHGLRPGPLFLRSNPQIFYVIIAGGLIASIFLLLLGLFVAPRLSKIIQVPKRLLLPIITVLCVIGAFAGNNRMFDVVVMFVFGMIGFFMRKQDYAVAPLTLALVLGKMMDSQFRRAVSLAASEDSFFTALLCRPITLILLAVTIAVLIANIPIVKSVSKNHGSST